MKALSPAQRQALKGRAHKLAPVVFVGAAGLSTQVLAEIDRSLKNHELIKIRALAADRGEREALLAEICRLAGAHPVQHIGRMLVVYRENPPPAEAPQAAARATRSGRR